MIKKSISIPIQLGGGIRKVDRAKELFDIGIDRIILGTIAIENPKIVKTLSREYPKKIEKKIIEYITKRIERSYGKILDFIYKVDQFSLINKKPIDYKSIKKILEE